MSQSIIVPNLRDGYVAIGQRILKYGEPVTSRGYACVELEDVVIEVQGCSNLLPIGVGRELKPAIGFGEALLLCGGLASPSLMESISPSFARFMDGGDLHGAYGRRIRPQMARVIEILREDPGSRQAIVSVWDPQYDQQQTRDLPCTLMFGFRIREGELHMTTVMRSQDYWLGLAYDLFMFGQLGWTVANTLGVSFHSIRHHVMSLHVYARDEQKLSQLHTFSLDSITVVESEAFSPQYGLEPAGFYGGILEWESARGRAERLYNKQLDDASWSEQIYKNVLDRYPRQTQLENFAS